MNYKPTIYLVIDACIPRFERRPGLRGLIAWLFGSRPMVVISLSRDTFVTHPENLSAVRKLMEARYANVVVRGRGTIAVVKT